MSVSSPKHDEQVFSNLVQLVRSRSPEGIKLMDVLLDYKIRFGEYLDVIAMGFNSIFEFCAYARDHCHNSLTIVERDKYYLKSERLFFNEKQYLIWINELQQNRDYETLERLVSTSLSDNIVYHGSCNALPELVLPRHTLHPDLIKYNLAKIIYVVSPFEIYIHLRGPHYDIAYKKLRESLRFYDAFYGNSDEKYLMPPELATAGYYCVVRNPEDNYSWHRARIISNYNGIVTLFAIDYGNTINDTVDELRLIKMVFFQYPPLAIKVALEGIIPKFYPKDWCSAATTFIRKFVGKFSHEHYLLCAFLHKIEPQLQKLDDDFLFNNLDKNYYLVTIFDAVPQEDKYVFINQELVRRDLAIISDDTNLNPIKFPINIDYENCEIEKFKNRDKSVELWFKYESNNNSQLKSLMNQVKQISVSTINDNVILSTIDDNNTGSVMYDNRNKYFPIEQSIVCNEQMYLSIDMLVTKVYQKPKYFPIEKSIDHKRKYFPVEKTIDHKLIYFPIEKAINHKSKYFPIEKVVECKMKYLSKEMLLPVDNRRRYLSVNDKICDFSHIFAPKI